MAFKPPPGFITITEASEKRDEAAYNVIGLCTDYLAPRQSGGTDLAMKLSLWDQSCAGHSGKYSDGMTVRFFYKEKACFPNVEAIGDVVVLRRLKTKRVRGDWIGMASHTTTWNVVSANSLLNSRHETLTDVLQRPHNPGTMANYQDSNPNFEILGYAKSTLTAKDPASLNVHPKPAAVGQVGVDKTDGGRIAATIGRKYRMLKDLQDPADCHSNQFADLLGEVKRAWLYGNPMEIKFTDYTAHPLLYDNQLSHQDGIQPGDEFGYQNKPAADNCPRGRMTIKINLWDEHAENFRLLLQKCDGLKSGVYFRVRNAHIKMDKGNTQLEASLRGSTGKFGTGGISLLHSSDSAHDDDLKALLIRKREYELRNPPKELEMADSMGPPPRPVSLVKSAQTDVAGTKSSSKALKNQANRMKNQKSKNNKQIRGNTKKSTSVAIKQSNQHVKCEAISARMTTVVDILDVKNLQRTTPAGNDYQLPFQNCKYKSAVRVIDYFPDDLKDFATPYRISEYENLSDYESERDEAATLDVARNDPDNTRWRWHFFLLVEDAKIPEGASDDRSTMLLQVAGQDGDYLLDMTACDLRGSSKDFARLKEKLFVLWGELEEKKVEHNMTGQELKTAGIEVSSTSFECFIKEFGVLARTADGKPLQGQWERMFGLFKTTVG